MAIIESIVTDKNKIVACQGSYHSYFYDSKMCSYILLTVDSKQECFIQRYSNQSKNFVISSDLLASYDGHEWLFTKEGITLFKSLGTARQNFITSSLRESLEDTGSTNKAIVLVNDSILAENREAVNMLRDIFMRLSTDKTFLEYVARKHLSSHIQWKMNKETGLREFNNLKNTLDRSILLSYLMLEDTARSGYCRIITRYTVPRKGIFFRFNEYKKQWLEMQQF